jgi:beta-glucanase (GH16 family)
MCCGDYSEVEAPSGRHEGLIAAQRQTVKLATFKERVRLSREMDKLRAMPSFSRQASPQGHLDHLSPNTTGQSGTTVFFDDFLGSSLSAQWTAMNRCGDVSNSEVQCYLPANVGVANSLLSITSKSQSQTCSDHNIDGSVRNGPFNNSFTSGMVQWTSFNYLYGTLEFKAKMPNFAGMWPGSLFLLGCNCLESTILSADNIGLCNWPFDSSRSGEIDIAEFKGTTTVPAQNSAGSGSGFDFSGTATMSDASAAFHVFKLVWAPGSLTWFIDGAQTNQYVNANVPSHAMFAIINVAMGGAGGTVTGSGLPATMQFDYVKVTQP